MMSVLFQREPEGFWQAAPRERPLWALVVALAMLALFVAALCVLAVGARAETTGDLLRSNGMVGVSPLVALPPGCEQITKTLMTCDGKTAGQLTTNEPIAVPCTGCILVDGKWVQTAPPGFHRTRCLPVGSDQIVDCWVEEKPAK